LVLIIKIKKIMIMKIIKSLNLIIVCLCTTTVLHAQEIKTEIAKPVEVKATTQGGRINTPSPQPELKPQPQVAAISTDAPPAAEAPSPLTRREEAKPAVKEKTEVKIASDKDVVTPGGEEGRKIMTGNTTQPAPEINSQPTIDTRPAPQVKMAKPVNGRQQQ
jgi:hypothetical protein